MKQTSQRHKLLIKRASAVVGILIMGLEIGRFWVHAAL